MGLFQGALKCPVPASYCLTVAALQAENGAAIVSVAGLLTVANSQFLRNTQAQYGGASESRHAP